MSLGGWAARTAVNLVPRLSFRSASRGGRGLGTLAWAADARHRRVADANLARAFPDMPAAARGQLVRQAFQQAGRTAVEMLWTPALDTVPLATIASFSGKEHLDAALAAGQGALITTAHFGNWELMGVALARSGVPMNVITRKIDDPDVEHSLQGLRTRTGAHVVHKENAVRASLKILRAGDVVGVLIDQNTIASQATFVPFFGRLAATTKLAAQLHLRTGAPILMTFCVPRGDSYEFVIEPPLEPELDGLSSEQKMSVLTAAATARIESRIREHPGAWLWIHDRWRTPPPAVAASDEALGGDGATAVAGDDGPAANESASIE